MQINLPTCLAMYALGLSVVMTAALPLPGHDCPLCAKLEVKPMTSNFCEVCWDYPVFEAPPHAEPYSSTDHQSEHFAMGTSLQSPGPGVPQTLPGQHSTEPPPHSPHDQLVTSSTISDPSHGKPGHIGSSPPPVDSSLHGAYGILAGPGLSQALTRQQHTGPPAHSQYRHHTPFQSSIIRRRPLAKYMGSNGKMISNTARTDKNRRIARDFYVKYANKSKREIATIQEEFKSRGGKMTYFDKIVEVAQAEGIKLK
ncbi:hypothetical protein H0H93_016728, partial [Arthromyces matolae]